MITSFVPIPLGGDAYRLTWASDLPSPTFYLYVDGELVLTTAATSADVAGIVGVVYDVFDDPTPPAAGFPATMTLAWHAAAGAATYRVERLVGASWTAVATITAGELDYFTYVTDVLADDTVHSFRVVPVSQAGNDGTPATFTALMVRHPDVPVVDYAYDADDGTVTITAA